MNIINKMSKREILNICTICLSYAKIAIKICTQILGNNGLNKCISFVLNVDKYTIIF